MNWLCEECGTGNSDEGKLLSEGDIVFCKDCTEASIIMKVAVKTERKELDFNGDGWRIRVGQVYSTPSEALHLRVTKIVLDSTDKNGAWIYYMHVDPDDHNKVQGLECRMRAWCVNREWDLEEDVNLSKSEFATEVVARVRRNMKFLSPKWLSYSQRCELFETINSLSDIIDELLSRGNEQTQMLDPGLIQERLERIAQDCIDPNHYDSDEHTTTELADQLLSDEESAEWFESLTLDMVRRAIMQTAELYEQKMERLRGVLKRIGDLRFLHDPVPDIARLVDETLEEGTTADE